MIFNEKVSSVIFQLHHKDYAIIHRNQSKIEK
jgi:hypothetical protein